MGLLSLGTPFTFTQTENYVDHVHKRGIIQLKNIFSTNMSRDKDQFFWGDEIEYMLVHFDSSNRNATLDVEHDYILKNFEHGTKKHEEICVTNDILFHPEYGRFMVEATPLKPYGDSVGDFLSVEKNMEARRRVMRQEIISVDGGNTNVIPLTITSFPLMGIPEFTTEKYEPKDPASHSLFLPENIINRHVRFPTLTRNIRERRGQKVAINVPIFPDKNTQALDKLDYNIPKRDLFPEDKDPFLGAALPGHIYMDSMGFGMGCSCLQVTMQAPDIDKSRYLYDSLLPLTPIFLALSAASSVFKGTLADQDVRWNVISNAVDDRTPIERGVKPLASRKAHGGVSEARASSLRKISKSRYDSVSSYLGDYDRKSREFNNFDQSFNDIELEINEEVYKSLLEDKNFDDVLAQHFAHLFIRDPLVLFSEKVKVKNDEFDDDHFQNIQSTNWQTLRFKPPAAHSQGCLSNTPGWRVEFRPMEIQLTDFENAAYSVFLILVAKAILKYEPNYYIPISKIDENMATAHKRNSLLKDGFWFKGTEGPVKLSIGEIINGCPQFFGFVPLVEKYVSEVLSKESSSSDLKEISYYIKLISLRASGKIPTLSHFSRDYITSHADYKQDSLVSRTVNYDYLSVLQSITDYSNSNGHLFKLFGDEIGEYLINRKGNADEKLNC